MNDTTNYVDFAQALDLLVGLQKTEPVIAIKGIKAVLERFNLTTEYTRVVLEVVKAQTSDTGPLGSLQTMPGGLQ